ncbi:MAG TPA: MBL fold metallo-hydrolase [Candidatus Dormibacteraeota bacterium]|jgi:glyoxylase-like metal-dependent hydrolase (beta-lactamase superfamily II)
MTPQAGDGFPFASHRELDQPPQTRLAEDHFRMGEVELRLVPDAPVFIDGGAMFGVVPKTLWIKHKIPDDHNRVPVASNCLLVQGPSGTALIEGGIGEKYSDKQRDIFGLDDVGRLKRGLKAAQVEPEEVDHVFLTHLHFDHCGAITTYDGSRLRPTFPRARHFVQRAEYEIMMNPDPRSSPSYVPDNLEAVREAGLLELVDGDAQPVPGFELRLTPGHTAGHQVVLVHTTGGTAAFMGDLIPYRSHLKTTWVAATDVQPVQTMTTKQSFLAEVRELDYLVVLYHEHIDPVGRFRGDVFERF